MIAKEGDWLVVEAVHVGEKRRRGLVLGVRGQDGAPPFVVRWTGSDNEVLVFPGDGCRVVSAEEINEATWP